jgi:hypothetical protein
MVAWPNLLENPWRREPARAENAAGRELTRGITAGSRVAATTSDPAEIVMGLVSATSNTGARVRMTEPIQAKARPSGSRGRP